MGASWILVSDLFYAINLHVLHLWLQTTLNFHSTLISEPLGAPAILAASPEEKAPLSRHFHVHFVSGSRKQTVGVMNNIMNNSVGINEKEMPESYLINCRWTRYWVGFSFFIYFAPGDEISTMSAHICDEKAFVVCSAHRMINCLFTHPMPSAFIQRDENRQSLWHSIDITLRNWWLLRMEITASFCCCHVYRVRKLYSTRRVLGSDRQTFVMFIAKFIFT